MMLKTLITVTALCACLLSCNQREDSRKGDLTADKPDSAYLDSTGLGKAEHAVKEEYASNTSDVKTAASIQKVLPSILRKELVGADSSGRRFVYYETDLNEDGKGEFLIGFTGMNWCGSGGCTALLLSSEGGLITHFTVVGFPFKVLNQKTGGWRDIVVHSGGADRLLKWDGKSYPKNPSLAPKFTGEPNNYAQIALDFSNKRYPWFPF